MRQQQKSRKTHMDIHIEFYGKATLLEALELLGERFGDGMRSDNIETEKFLFKYDTYDFSETRGITNIETVSHSKFLKGNWRIDISDDDIYTIIIQSKMNEESP